MKDTGGELIFEIVTPLSFTVRCTSGYWEFITTYKHPLLVGREREVERALANPTQVRRSRKDPEVYLFYGGAAPRWTCAVTRRSGNDGFLITAYPTDAIKAGEIVWTG